MARVSRGSGSLGRRPALPSANEVMSALNKGFESGFIGVPTAASRAEFSKIKDIVTDSDVLGQYNPTQYQNLAGQPADQFEEYYDIDDKIFSRQFYEVVKLDDDKEQMFIPGLAGPQLGEDESPADLTLVPTSTTNPDRPRTVAAGYDESEEKLTVMFRDGTLYNYYEVDENEWAAFKANKSKGAIIYRMLDFKPRGPADASSVSAKQQEALYRVARGVQSFKGGKIASQNKAVYKTLTPKQKAKKNQQRRQRRQGR